MKHTVVLGIGNRLMMDDGIGVYVVERLRDENRKGAARSENCNEKLSYMVGETDIDYCLDAVGEARFIIVIDAVCAGNSPGDVTVFPLEKSASQPYRGLSAHNLHLFDLLNHCNEGWEGSLIGIEPFEIRLNVGISDVLAGRFDEITDKVKNISLKLNEGFWL